MSDTPRCHKCWQEGFWAGVVATIGGFFTMGVLLAGLTIWYL